MIMSSPTNERNDTLLVALLPLVSALGAALVSIAVMVFGAPSASALEQTPDDVVGWGYNIYGQAAAPPDARNVKAIAAGDYLNLALKEDGTVVAWGSNGVGQTNIPTGLANVKAIAAGDYHSLALKEDGTVVAWGDNVYGQSTVPSELGGVKAIAAGGAHSLVIRDRPPSVKRVLPTEDATAIAPRANLSAFFSEPMRNSSINTFTIKLYEAGTSTPIEATVSYTETTSATGAKVYEAILNPTTNLQRGARYQAQVTTGVRDLAGNRLDQDQTPLNGYQPKVWFFRVST
jgi:hypothetical protein